MLHASESPQNAVAYSLLPVFLSTPIELLADASPVAAVPGAPPAQQSGPKPFPTLLAGQAPARSLSMVQASSLKPTDGIRWLTGPERLSIMGFAWDWMRPTCRGSGCRQRRCAASRGMDRPEAEGDLCVGLEGKQYEGAEAPFMHSGLRVKSLLDNSLENSQATSSGIRQ
jgi:hypothetical protein